MVMTFEFAGEPATELHGHNSGAPMLLWHLGPIIIAPRASWTLISLAVRVPESSDFGLGPSRGAKMVLCSVASPVWPRNHSISLATWGDRLAVVVAVADLSRTT